MNNNNNNNNKKPVIRDDKRFNDFLATNLDATINDRYCQKCHLKMVHNPRNIPQDRYIYSCPRCNVTSNIHQTEPEEKIMVQFPTHNAQSTTTNKKLITQSDSERLPRSTYFINKNIEKKNEIEVDDPYLAILKRRNDLRITNVEYYEPTEYDY